MPFGKLDARSVLMTSAEVLANVKLANSGFMNMDYFYNDVKSIHEKCSVNATAYREQMNKL